MEMKSEIDAEEYLADIVGPTIEGFTTNPISKRHAFLACAVTFHTIDYPSFPKSSRGLRQSFYKQFSLS